MTREGLGKEQRNLDRTQDGHQQSRPESRRDSITPGRPGFTPHGNYQRGSTPSAPIDLTRNARHPEHKSSKHVHRNDPLFKTSSSSKQSALSSDRFTKSETARTTSPDSKFSSKVFQSSQASPDLLQESLAQIQKDLDRERRAHLQTKNELTASTEALKEKEKNLRDQIADRAALIMWHEENQQRLKHDQQKQLQSMRVAVKQNFAPTIAAQEEALEALSTEVQTVRKDAEEKTRMIQESLDAKDCLLSEKDEAIKALGIEVLTVKEDLNEKIRSMKENLDAKDLAIEAAKTDSTARITQLETSVREHEASKKLYEAHLLVNEDFARKFTRQDTRNKNLDKKWSEAKEKLKSSQTAHEAEVLQLKAHIEELQDNFDSQNAQRDMTVKKLLQQVQDSQGLSQRYNFKVPDEELREEWGNLQHNIRQSIDEYTRPILQPAAQLDGRWTVLSPVIPELMASSLHYAFAFEAYIWEWLCLVVFNPDSLAWAGELGRSLEELSSRIDERIRGPHDDLTSEYHSWRATSSHLLSRMSNRGDNELSRHSEAQKSIREVTQSLHMLLEASFDQENAFADLSAILKEARAFEVKRRKMKSKVEVCFGHCDDTGKAQRYDMPVDDSLMRAREPRLPSNNQTTMMGPGPIVKLVVSPAIVRWGNSNGVDYDRKTCLVKMDVLVLQPPDIVPERARDLEQTVAAGNVQLGQKSTGADERCHSVTILEEENTKNEQNGSSTTLNHSAQYPQSSFAPTVLKKTRPSRHAADDVRKRCFQQLNQGRDELSGEPHDYVDSSDSKPSRSKKRKTTDDGNAGQ